jgi:hypothetical protein
MVKRGELMLSFARIAIFIIGALALGYGVAHALRMQNTGARIAILCAMILGFGALVLLVGNHPISALIRERGKRILVGGILSVLAVLFSVLYLPALSGAALERYSRFFYWTSVILVGVYLLVRNVKHFRH